MATQQFSKLSVRENAGKNYAHFNAYWSLQPSTLGQFLFPAPGAFPRPRPSRIGHPRTLPATEVKRAGAMITSETTILANFGYLRRLDSPVDLFRIP
jgi:hypothetical protein